MSFGTRKPKESKHDKTKLGLFYLYNCNIITDLNKCPFSAHRQQWYIPTQNSYLCVCTLHVRTNGHWYPIYV